MSEEQISTLSADTCLMVKGKFRAGSQNLYGLFLIQFGYDGHLLSTQISVSSYSDTYSIPLDSSWYDFESAIIQGKWKGAFNSGLTTSLQSQLEKLRQDTSYRTQIFSSVINYDLSGLNASLYDLINRIIHDKQLTLDCSIESTTLNSINEAKRQRENPKAAEPVAPASAYNLEKGSIILSGALILSPVKGKALFDLRIGDRIMVKIDHTVQSGQIFIDSHQLRVEGRVRPVPTEVVDVKAESRSSPVEILCRIDANYYVKCIESERQVKLRLYDPRIDGVYNFDQARKETASGRPRTGDQSSGISPTMLALAGVLFFLLVVFIIIIYIML
jgi:hypothetical protein